MQANLGDQWTILFIAAIAYICTIVTIWIPITAIRLEDTPLGAISTRPSIRILDSWEVSVTLAITDRVIHISTVLTQGLDLSTAGH